MMLSLKFHPRYVMLGNWLEATRVAALRCDTSYFKHPKVRAEAVVAASFVDAEPPVHASLLRLRNLVFGNPGSRFNEIARESTAALTALTN